MVNGQKIMATGQFTHTIAEIDANVNEVVTARGNYASLGTALNTKQNALTFDTAPTASSPNPVTSDGIYTALQGAPLPDTVTDFNSLTDSAVYLVSAGTSASHPPSTAAGVLTVSAFPSGTLQIFQTAAHTFRRSCSGGTWTNWYRYDGTDTGA